MNHSSFSLADPESWSVSSMKAVSERFISRASACICLSGQTTRVSENGQRIAGGRRLGKNIKLNEIVAGSHTRKYLFV
jgi:hypothetical protein